MDAPKILKTKDYEKFKNLTFNRDKQKSLLTNLKRSIQEENLLHLHPIIVNHDMEIVDGQHRFEVAKELGLDIYYVIGEASYDHILRANQMQKCINLTDVIKFYANKDHNKDYMDFQEIVLKLDIKPKATLGLILGTSGDSIANIVKSGKFRLPSDRHSIDKIVDLYLRFVGWATEKRITPLAMFKTRNFTQAFRQLSMHEIEEETLFIKLDQKWFEIKPQASQKLWCELLVEIYNFRNSKTIQLEDL